MIRQQAKAGSEAGYKNYFIKNAALEMSGIFYAINDGL